MPAHELPTVYGTAPRVAIHLPSYSDDPLTTWTQVIEIAHIAERLGVDRLTVAEHVVLGEHLDDYARPELGGRAGATQPTGPNGSFLDPLVLLAHIAGVTSRIRLGTAVLLAAIRRPVVLAKQAATLDVLSSGRLDLGVGIGWQRDEYLAAGVDFTRRGRILDECLEICHLLWTTTNATYRSDRLSFENIHQMPKPAQVGGVPIWVGGSLDQRVIARIVRFASGWIPWGPAAEDLPTAMSTVRRALLGAGRDPATFAVSVDLPTPASSDAKAVRKVVARVPELMELGVTDFRIRVTLDPRKAHDLLRTFVPMLQSAT